jgi:CubicO group peptidase (beta-lactamase class C family)
MSLDDALGDVVEAFSKTDKKTVTIGQLVSHTSGLPDYKPYYEALRQHPMAERQGLLRRKLLDEKLVNEPGRHSLYGDVGFMILDWVVEAVAQAPLDRVVDKLVYEPLGLDHLFFVRKDSDSQRNDISYAATEDCPWRGKVLDGEVHDDNAYVMGGVAGHAGLFGMAKETYQLLQELLKVHSGEPNSGLFRQDVVQTFLQRQSDAGSWALGFDTPTRPDSSSGKYFSDESVGHLGFTGTSFWMDLVKGIIVVLLTNRIHPNRENERIKAFRPVLHDAVMETLLS